MSKTELTTKDIMTLIGCGALAVWIVSLPFLWVLHGWTLSYLWQWFVSPVFGIRELSIAEAIGIAIAVSYLTKSHMYTERDSDEAAKAAIYGLLISITNPLVALGIGYIAYQFIK